MAVRYDMNLTEGGVWDAQFGWRNADMSDVSLDDYDVVLEGRKMEGLPAFLTLTVGDGISLDEGPDESDDWITVKVDASKTFGLPRGIYALVMQHKTDPTLDVLLVHGDINVRRTGFARVS